MVRTMVIFRFFRANSLKFSNIFHISASNSESKIREFNDGSSRFVQFIKNQRVSLLLDGKKYIYGKYIYLFIYTSQAEDVDLN